MADERTSESGEPERREHQGRPRQAPRSWPSRRSPAASGSGASSFRSTPSPSRRPSSGVIRSTRRPSSRSGTATSTWRSRWPSPSSRRCSLGQFTVSVVITFFVLLSEYIETYAVDRGRQTITLLEKSAPKLAFVRRGGKELEVDVGTLVPERRRHRQGRRAGAGRRDHRRRVSLPEPVFHNRRVGEGREERRRQRLRGKRGRVGADRGAHREGRAPRPCSGRS